MTVSPILRLVRPADGRQMRLCCRLPSPIPHHRQAPVIPRTRSPGTRPLRSRGARLALGAYIPNGIGRYAWAAHLSRHRRTPGVGQLRRYRAGRSPGDARTCLGEVPRGTLRISPGRWLRSADAGTGERRDPEVPSRFFRRDAAAEPVASRGVYRTPSRSDCPRLYNSGSRPVSGIVRKISGLRGIGLKIRRTILGGHVDPQEEFRPR